MVKLVSVKVKKRLVWNLCKLPKVARSQSFEEIGLLVLYRAPAGTSHLIRKSNTKYILLNFTNFGQGGRTRIAETGNEFTRDFGKIGNLDWTHSDPPVSPSTMGPRVTHVLACTRVKDRKRSAKSMCPICTTWYARNPVVMSICNTTSAHYTWKGVRSIRTQDGQFLHW